MPLITDILKNSEPKKRFQKKAYRPWDDEIPISGSENVNEEVHADKNLINDIQPLIEEKISNIFVSPINPENNYKFSAENVDFEKCLRDLFGAQRIVFKFLINLQVQELEDLFITQPIAANEIVLSTKLPLNTVNAVINRLKIKKLTQTYESKPGRGGYSRYSFAHKTYKFFSKKFAES